MSKKKKTIYLPDGQRLLPGNTPTKWYTFRNGEKIRIYPPLQRKTRNDSQELQGLKTRSLQRRTGSHRETDNEAAGQNAAKS